MPTCQANSFIKQIAFLLILLPAVLFNTSAHNQVQARTESLNILVDSSRDGGAWWSPQTAPFDPNAAHQGKALADYLRTLGHVVAELPVPTTITSGLLSSHDIVIRANEYGGYSASELTAYQDYVDSGGRLLLLSDFVRPGEQDSLGLSFGITFEGISRGENVVKSFVPHPITDGVAPMQYGVGSGIISYPDNASLLGYLSNDTYLDLNDNEIKDPGEPAAAPVLGATLFGKGKIVFAGDTNMWLWLPQPLVDNTLDWLARPSCYHLTIEKEGQGSVPTTNPTKSTGCENEYFHEGDSITLTEHPAVGYHLDYWTGTDSASSNQLTMPASDHTVTAHYAPACYELTTGYTGQGSYPTASPTHSTGCASGRYHVGEAISMTPHPVGNYSLDHWTGTDSASSNQLTMPASDHIVTAHYAPICYELTTNHTGQGSDPTASPTHSSGCGSGWYHMGEAISMTPHPASNHHVDHWTGTDNSSSNLLTMPNGDHTVTAHYVEGVLCYTLTRTHTGSGGDPTASPEKSSACEATDEFVAGESISLQAHPGDSWQVKNWNGTNDNSSTSTINTVLMPAADHTVAVTYETTTSESFDILLPYIVYGNID